MTDLTSAMRTITKEFDRATEIDTLERAQRRVSLIFEMFYDDEPEDPGLAIRDCLTDLMHLATQRGVNIQDTITAASEMWTQECEDWGIGPDSGTTEN